MSRASRTWKNIGNFGYKSQQRYKEDEQNRIIDDWHGAKSIIKLGKSWKYPEENGLPVDGLWKYLYKPCKKHRNKKRPAFFLFGVKSHAAYTEL